MLPFAACAFGIYLGMNFNVIVLAAASFAGMVILTALSCFSGAGATEGAAWAVLNVVLCQAGYMLGLTAREALAQFLARLKVRQSKRI